MEIDTWNFDDRELNNPAVIKRQKEPESKYRNYAIMLAASRNHPLGPRTDSNDYLHEHEMRSFIIDIFEKTYSTAIPYIDFARAGWSDEDYIHYCEVCSGIRAWIIAMDSAEDDDHSVMQKRLQEKVRSLLEWLNQFQDEPIQPDFDLAFALTTNAKYLRYCEYDDIGTIPDIYRSDADFRQELERLICSILSGNAGPIMIHYPMCQTKERTRLLLEDYQKRHDQIVDEFDYGIPDGHDLYAWARKKANAISELQKIDDTIVFLVERIAEFDNGGEFDVSKNILYVYRGRIKCEQAHHNIICVNAVLPTASGVDVTLNVNYCTECRRFFISYSEYTHYMIRYGTLIAKFCLISDSGGEFADQLAEESPLKLCGYSVSQDTGYSRDERQNLLAGVMQHGIMKKSEIIKYLTWFIQVNGNRFGNELARSKWESDLAFVREYDFRQQPTRRVSGVKIYPGYSHLK